MSDNIPKTDQTTATSSYETGIDYAENPVVNSTYNSIVKSMDESCFTNIEESIDPKSKLSKFYTRTFKVGNTDTFELLSNEYETAINSATDKMDEYVEKASKAKAEIEAAIAQDQKAHKMAEQARIDTANNYPSFVQEYDKKTGKPINSYDDYCNARAAAVKKAYNDTWNANCWKPKA